MPLLQDPNPDLIRIAQEAGLNPSLISVDDFSIDGDTITYRYMLLDDDGKIRVAAGVVLKSEWMTAKVGGGK